MNISPFFLLPLQKFSSHPEFSRYFDTNRGRVCRTRYASRIYSTNSSTRGNERYGKWRGGIKDGKERTTREENERKILLSVIFLARPLSLSFVLRYRRNRSVIIWRLFGYIYPNIYPNGPPTFPLGKIKYLVALTVALRGRIPFVSQRRTSYIVSNSASRHRDYREERSGGREGEEEEGEQECYVLHALSRNFAPIKVQRGEKSANKGIVLPVAPRLKRSATRHHFNYRNIFPTGRADRIQKPPPSSKYKYRSSFYRET